MGLYAYYSNVEPVLQGAFVNWSGFDAAEKSLSLIPLFVQLLTVTRRIFEAAFWRNHRYAANSIARALVSSPS